MCTISCCGISAGGLMQLISYGGSDADDPDDNRV